MVYRVNGCRDGGWVWEVAVLIIGEEQVEGENGVGCRGLQHSVVVAVTNANFHVGEG